MMGLWIPLLLHLHLAAGVSLPPPLNVSITSFNMEHTLSFLPGPGTAADAHFRVHILRFRRKNSWKPVAGCLELTARQTCNLTRPFKDSLDQYKARVQAFTPSQVSSWTLSEQFHPVIDTVLGPPDVSVSGCGNCLVLQVRPPVARGLQQRQQLLDLYRELHCLVRRTRDGAQFSLNLPYEEESVISYLQPEVEYCVTVTVTTVFNPHAVPTKAHCAFTSPPPASSSVRVVLGLLFVFSLLGLLLVGFVVYGGQLTSKLPRQQHLPRILSYIPLQGQNPGGAQPEPLSQISASQTHGDATADSLPARHGPAGPRGGRPAEGEEDEGLPSSGSV
ncbi:interferon alpha/beta receptor 2-like isoform X2 [Centroberyx affinis]|uniref:interferon alpha/beta receptor 2-like isoform X2 n=1 Tax=Centroberyx affinis TaxID=166261 RepID=UPI003A5C5B1F